MGKCGVRKKARRRLLIAAGAGLMLAAGTGGSAASTATPDCPASLDCVVIPAAYGPDGHGGYGNYDQANRPADGLTIDSIVIHDTEYPYPGTVSAFTDPAHHAAANYLVQSSTGDVTEMVRPRDVAWATGNWYYNTHSVSIENEGFAAAGFTPAEYTSDAALVRYLARRYGVPLDREHIVGHDNVGGVTDAENATQHTDPGPHWNWDYFMSLVRGQSEPAYLASQGSVGVHGHHVVTISPRSASNSVYLRTRPSPAAPLLSDPTPHPGITKSENWSATAIAGGQYVLAGQSGDWTGIWFGGQIGWFRDPPGPGATARFTGAWAVTPRPGLAAVPVYGGASPEDPALAYRLRAGQAYVTAGPVPDDDYDAAYGSSGTVIHGRRPYYQVQFNSRLYYVNADDVTLKYLR